MLIMFKHLNSMFAVSFLTMTRFLMVMPDSGGKETLGQQYQRLPSPSGSPPAWLAALAPDALPICPFSTDHLHHPDAREQQVLSVRY